MIYVTVTFRLKLTLLICVSYNYLSVWVYYLILRKEPFLFLLKNYIRLLFYAKLGLLLLLKLNYSLYLVLYCIFQCVFVLNCYFLNRMLHFLRDHNGSKIFYVTQQFCKDLIWFCTFLNSYNGVTMYVTQPIYNHMYLHASLTALGGTFHNFVYTLTILIASCILKC